jgi:hypothetical protein
MAAVGIAPTPSPRVSFTRSELKAFTGATLPDLVDERVRLLFAGVNPGLRSVAVQGHFAPRGNRFLPGGGLCPEASSTRPLGGW